MKKITLSNRDIWIGKHITIGFLLYDEKNQKNVTNNNVRVFLLEEQKTGLFRKEILREKLSKITKDDENLLKEILDRYKGLFVNSRFTHCYACKRDLNSIDFSICTTCKWIKCQCSACGCTYNKFHD